ncbi:squamosa promoter-binding-like protein 12 [Salvia splendens]|uniref:squamosa promoter-binding-like protein 12 n=1 Tax=Salvia splendens TaxID=180675 RepID=UPI001C2681DC|nr:squamosa promoter-binding-like protein 12 [Salvia splendens]XP_042053366.1 squamosa promoter-binding-like protein 12 [Salvia splendens]XP_042053367.1 squamosa promoter-binding-like protein 12 [Salvia splendens]
MSHYLEMDWNTKWDWESYDAFGPKTTENPKKLQLVDLTIIDDREIDAGSFNLSAGASGSDGGHVSSAKSSISASDSSTKDGQTPPDFRLMAYEDISGNFKITEREGTKISGTSPPLEASIGSVEPLIGLKLGKRTYFENSGAGGHVKSAPSAGPTASTASLKKTKLLGDNLPMPRCVVEGCNSDLSTAKEYHRKHRVCDSHSKAPKVVVGGLERRFCQQCSRFHNISEFDEKKRSCRRRLSDHNARRRKPQQEIQYNSRLSSPFYGGRQQMSFMMSNPSLVHSRAMGDTAWDSTKFTLTKGYHPLKSSGDGVSREQMHIPGAKLTHFTNMQSSAAKGIPTSKSSVADVSNPGSKYSPHLDAAPEYGRALSLLSSNSWAPCGSESMALNQIQENEICVSQPLPTMHGIPEGVPLSSSELWLHQLPSAHPPLPGNTNFPEIQLFITPYEETDLYSSIMN